MTVRMLAVAMLLGSATAASAQVTITGDWVRAVPPVSDSTAAYFVVRNTGSGDLVLQGAKADIAGHTMMHKTVVHADGTSGMQPIGQVTIPAGGQVVFKPGERHLMLMKLKRVPKAGEKVNVCLKISGQFHCQPFPVRREAPR